MSKTGRLQIVVVGSGMGPSCNVAATTFVCLTFKTDLVARESVGTDSAKFRERGMDADLNNFANKAMSTSDLQVVLRRLCGVGQG